MSASAPRLEVFVPLLLRRADELELVHVDAELVLDHVDQARLQRLETRVVLGRAERNTLEVVLDGEHRAGDAGVGDAVVGATLHGDRDGAPLPGEVEPTGAQVDDQLARVVHDLFFDAHRTSLFQR